MARSVVGCVLWRAGIAVVGLGTVASGFGLLDFVVRPGTIERVETLALVGVAGLIVLPPMTLAMAVFDWRRRRSPVSDSVVPARPVEQPVVAVAPVVPPVGDVARPRPVRTGRSEPRRIAGGALMSAIADELVRDGAGGAAKASARVTQHDGRRRDPARRHGPLEGVWLSDGSSEGPGEDLTDSMFGAVVTAG